MADMNVLFKYICMLSHIIIGILFLFPPCLYAANIRDTGLEGESSLNPCKDLGLFGESNGREVQKPLIEKALGEDSGYSRLLLLTNVRLLLGFQNYEKKTSSHEEIAPSPASAPVDGGDVTPHAVFPFFKNEDSHHPALRPSFILPNDLSFATSERKNSGFIVSRGTIIIVVSTVGPAAFIMILFGLMRFRRKKKQKPVRTLLLPGFCGDQLEMNCPGSDQGPEHFYMNSLSPSRETICDFKHPTHNLNVLYKVDMQSFLAKGQVNKLVAENHLPLNHNEFLPESMSEDEEAFHSVCGSQTSSRRLSDFSDANSPLPSLASSPLDLPKRNFSPGEAYLSSPCRPIAPDATPVSPLNLNSSPSSSATSAIHFSKAPSTPVGSHNENPPPPLPPPPSLVLPLPPQAPPPPLLKVPTPPHTRLSVAPQAQQSSSIGRDGNRLPKLKPLHWDKVRAAPDSSMVWDKLRAGSFEFDEEMIESLFGYNTQNSAWNEEPRTKSCSPSKNVLDPKRLQNITILSKALNASPGQVYSALTQGNGLSVEQLEALAKMAPTNEEEEKLSNYAGDVRELGLGERFLKEMLNLPFAFLRVEAMLYKGTFEDEILHLKKSFVMIEDACKELKSSRLFLKLLEAVLKTGNRMNDGTTRGGAKAFKLDALLKLADVKGTDGKTTLLHFVVQEMIRCEAVHALECTEEKANDEPRYGVCEEREKCCKRTGLDHVSGLSTELRNVKKTAGVDLDALTTSISKLSEEKLKLSKLIEDEAIHGKGGNFVELMKHFLNHADNEIKRLEQDEERVLHMVRRITEYFHGDMSKDEVNPLQIFVIVSDFLGMLDHVCKEIKSLKPRNSRQISTRTANISLSIGGWPAF